MALKLFNLLALTSLAILGCSFGTTPVNANGLDGLAHSSGVAHRSHSEVAVKRRRGLSKRCSARTAPTASAAPAPAPSAAANAGGDPNANNNNNNNGGTSGSSGGSPYSGPSGYGKKVGLAWGGSNDQIKNFVTGQVGVFYNWSPQIPDEVRQLGIEGIPMFWGTRDIDQFQQLVVPGYASTVLGFNEPNEPGQANLDPWTAAGLWKQYIQPLAGQGYKLIGPAMSSNPNGVTWTQNFMAACDGCTFDGLAVHWYDVNAQDFIAYINNYHNLFNLPIWVTEFACQNYNGGAQCTQDYIYEFMGTVTSYMNSQDWVEHYFAFGAMIGLPDAVNPDNELMGDDGMPTSLGWQFLNGN